MAIVQQSMEMDMWEIKEKLAERRKQMAIRAYEEERRRAELNQKIEENKRCEEWNQKLEEAINLIDSFIQNPISSVKTPPVTTKVPSVQNTPYFKENSGQSYTCSDEVTKELKDISFKGVHVIDSNVADGYGGENLPQTNTILKNLNSKDIGTCIGAPGSANNQDQRSTTWVRDQSRVLEKDVPSHGPRKQQLSGLIFCAEIEPPVGFDLRTFEGLHCDLSRGQERRTWNPGITYHQ